MMLKLLLLAAVAVVVAAQTAKPDVYQCIAPGVYCANRYAGVLPDKFGRGLFADSLLTTSGSASLKQASNDASFIVFDLQKGPQILGPSPKLEKMFNLSRSLHEAPVYVPEHNKLFFSELQANHLEQWVVDLNHELPVIEPYKANPPLYAPNGATLYQGLVYWGVCGGGLALPDGKTARPGIYTLNVTTGISELILNNYFGYYFNNIDDLAIDKRGDIWFTDPTYAYNTGLNTQAPQLETATYRFRPSTGAVNIVEDTLVMPNGIAFSPDQKKLYISDTSATNGYHYNSTGKRTIYSFDMTDDGLGLKHKRALYLASSLVPDGLKVARNGYIVTAAGRGVDVIDENGTLLLRIATPFSVQNIAWAGQDFEDLWLVGSGGVARVKWNLKGIEIR